MQVGPPASRCSYRAQPRGLSSSCRAAAVVALWGERVGAPVGRPRTGGVRDLGQARAVHVDGVDLAVYVVVEGPDERDLRPVGRPCWFVATLGTGIGVRATTRRGRLDVDLMQVAAVGVHDPDRAVYVGRHVLREDDLVSLRRPAAEGAEIEARGRDLLQPSA